MERGWWRGGGLGHVSTVAVLFGCFSLWELRNEGKDFNSGILSNPYDTILPITTKFSSHKKILYFENLKSSTLLIRILRLLI